VSPAQVQEQLLSLGRSRVTGAGSLAGAAGGGQEAAAPVQSSTGAIPKSISFDKTADKDDDSIASDHKSNNSVHAKKPFFKNWKLPKMGRRGGGRGSKVDDYHHRAVDRLTSSDTFNIPEHSESVVLTNNTETGEDILAKYRKKPAGEDKVDGNMLLHPRPDEEYCEDLEKIDRDNVEASFVFQDARRKLRLVLSEVNLPQAQNDRAGELMAILNLMLAQAINLHDRSGAAQIRETIRCISLLDQDIILKLVTSLHDEYRSRSPYIAYLVKSRQGLLANMAALDNLCARMEIESRMSTRFLITVCVRLFLERREEEIQHLLAQFSATNMMDEKTELVVSFLNKMWSALEQEQMFAATNEEQKEEARKAVERMIFSQLYMFALHPNQEADLHRDQVLQQHISRLSGIVTPGHRDLKIPRRYQYECPWPAAQAELRRLAAFKMPEDKVRCITRVSTMIMNLLSLAQDKSVPAADDFMPVLVFVIIKANPPSLLSTVQYVDNFYRDRLQGEDCYWWMQFVGAIEFIKTME